MQIKEVENLTGLTAKSIRLYEEKGLIKVDRNKDNQYRKYSQENIETLKVIKLLRYLEFSISEIKEILEGSLDDSFKMLHEKETSYQSEIDNKKMKIEIIQDLYECLKTECKEENKFAEITSQYTDIIPLLEQEFEQEKETLLDVNYPFKMFILFQSIICLVPIIGIFINLKEQKLNNIYIDVLCSLLATIILTFLWTGYFFYIRENKIKKDKTKKDNKYIWLSIAYLIICVILTCFLFCFINKIQIFLFAPDKWKFYSMDNLTVIMLAILLIFPLVSLFFNTINKIRKHKSDNLDDNKYKSTFKHTPYIKISKIVLWLILFYICFSKITFVTDKNIICYDFLHPQGVYYTYSQVTDIKTGFGLKRFSINEKIGQFYYRIKLDNKWIDLSLEEPQTYKDDYIELENFDNLIMKYNPNKISNEKGYENINLDKHYIERLLKIINNK